MKQYFQENKNLENQEKSISYDNNGETITFKTNTGLFSKDHIDWYSKILIDCISETKTKNILDLGCGYGFIGIALTKQMEYDNVTFIDVTKRACEYTKINCELNKVNNYEVILSDGIANKDNYDLITLNPPIHAGKEVMYMLYKQAIEHLNKDGIFYLVLHKKHGALSSLDYLKTLNNNVEVVYKKKGLFVIKIINN